MSDGSIQVVVAAFDTPIGASDMLKTLQAASAVGLDTIEDVAVVTRDTNGTLHVEEPADWGGARGAIVGGVVGVALGLLTGPVGWAAGLGAGLGGAGAEACGRGPSEPRPRP